MEILNIIDELDFIYKQLKSYERNGLDTSSLKIFIKNLKTFQKIQYSLDNKYSKTLSFEEKLDLIKAFLEDKRVFPRIKDIIEFANDKLELGFIDQKESRQLTIHRIISRIEKKPELKEKVKFAVLEIRNKKYHSQNAYRTKKEMENLESFAKWANILKNL